MRKFTCVLLALLLLFTAATPVFAAEPGLQNFGVQTIYTGFSDVSDSDWYAESVQTVCEYGLMKGKNAEKFSPSGNITVAETLATVCRLHDIYYGGSGEFEQAEPWYQVYIDTWRSFADDGFYSESTSFWTSPITRELFAYVIAQALPGEAYAALNQIMPRDIPDVMPGSDRTDAVYMLYNAGILTGSTENGLAGVFHPERPISRAEAAAILARIVVPSLRKTVILRSSVPETPVDGGSGSGNAGLPPAEDPADAASCDYVLNVNTDVFHYPGCKSVKRMKEENKRYYNGTRESVIGMGYRPCGNCNP